MKITQHVPVKNKRHRLYMSSYAAMKGDKRDESVRSRICFLL